MKKTSVALCLLLYCCGAHAQSASLVTQSKLHVAPKHQSKVITELAQGNQVDVLTRKRAWYQIKPLTEQAKGWVKMLNVRLIGVAKREGELGVASVLDSFTGRTSTESTGIRGFDEENFRNASANPNAVNQLNAFVPKAASLNRFVKSGQLTKAGERK